MQLGLMRIQTARCCAQTAIGLIKDRLAVLEARNPPAAGTSTAAGALKAAQPADARVAGNTAAAPASSDAAAAAPPPETFVPADAAAAAASAAPPPPGAAAGGAAGAAAPAADTGAADAAHPAAAADAAAGGGKGPKKSEDEKEMEALRDSLEGLQVRAEVPLGVPFGVPFGMPFGVDASVGPAQTWSASSTVAAQLQWTFVVLFEWARLLRSLPQSRPQHPGLLCCPSMAPPVNGPVTTCWMLWCRKPQCSAAAEAKGVCWTSIELSVPAAGPPVGAAGGHR